MATGKLYVLVKSSSPTPVTVPVPYRSSENESITSLCNLHFHYVNRLALAMSEKNSQIKRVPHFMDGSVGWIEKHLHFFSPPL